MDFSNGLDSIQVVDTRVNANLVQDCDASLLCRTVELAHRRGHVARSDHVCLGFDRRPYDIGMVYKGNERDDEVMFGDVTVEVGRLDVEGDGLGLGTGAPLNQIFRG